MQTPLSVSSTGWATRLRRFGRRHTTPILIILPFLLLFTLFGVWPVLRSLYLSFTDYNAIADPNFIGLKNYQDLLRDPRFFKALFNTTLYMVAVSLLGTGLGLALALVFGSQRTSDMAFRAAFFLPSVAGGVGLISVWKWIASSEDYGLFNSVRILLGLEPIRFLGTPDWALPVLIMMAVWGIMGYNMIIFVAGLRSVPGELYEAAAIDGAGPVPRFFRITLPLLRPTILYVLITGMIGSFQVFYEPYIMFSDVHNVGGILDSSLMLVVYLYEKGFHRFELGLASAIAWILFLILFLLTLINLRLGRSNDAD